MTGDEVLRRAVNSGWTFNYENSRGTGYSRQDAHGRWWNLTVSMEAEDLFVVVIGPDGIRRILEDDGEIDQALSL